MRRGKCRGCGASIVWIQTSAGRSMPCDAEPVSYREKAGAPGKIVTPNGMVLSCELDVQPEGAVYIGDSDVDIQTAHNSGLPCISVSWGFRDEAFLTEHGATTIVATREELAELLLNK